MGAITTGIEDYRRPGINDHNRSSTEYRRKDGENRNASDEKIDQMRRLAPDKQPNGSDRNRVRQDRMDRNPSNSSERIVPSNRSDRNDGSRNRDLQPNRPTSSSRTVIDSKPTTRASEGYHPSKPSPSPATTSSKPTYSPSKPSTPSTYSAPKPSNPSNSSYSAPRPQPRPNDPIRNHRLRPAVTNLPAARIPAPGKTIIAETPDGQNADP